MRAKATLLLLLAGSLSAQQLHWIGTWGASPSPQLADPAAIAKAKLAFNNQTLREIAHISVGGSMVRVRLSNAYGKDEVKIGAAHIAIRQQGSSILPNSDHTLTFSGQPAFTIPPNGLILSDPIALNVAPSSDLAISLYLPKSTQGAGIHYAAEQTNYVANGNVSASVALPDASTLTSWTFLSGIDVTASSQSFSVVTFGDSITDGARSTLDTNHRWPNFLADRILTQASSPSIGVVDEGIGGNRILHDPNANIAFGVNALARFDRDVLSQPGVKYVIVLEGINDLGHAGPALFPNEQVSAEEIIAGLKQLADRAHEARLKIYGATLTPFRGVPFNGYFSEEKEVKRQAVNNWIRTSGAFDAVIDFEKAVRDTTNPDRIAAAYDSGDHLHPKDEGYKAMADSIDLSLFK